MSYTLDIAALSQKVSYAVCPSQAKLPRTGEDGVHRRHHEGLEVGHEQEARDRPAERGRERGHGPEQSGRAGFSDQNTLKDSSKYESALTEAGTAKIKQPTL